MDINLLFAMRAVMTRGYQPTTAQQERKARFTNPSPLVAQAEAVERRFCQQVDAQATILCPVSGLLVSSDLPSFGDESYYLTSVHPIVYNAVDIINKPAYWAKFTPEQKAGLILAYMHTAKRVRFEGGLNAWAANLALSGQVKVENLDAFLVFLQGDWSTSFHCYPSLVIDRRFSFQTLVDYQNTCFSLAFAEAPTPAKLPALKTQSTKIQLKHLDAAAYEEWLEVASADFLPASFKDKVKPHAKRLVSELNISWIGGFLSKLRDLADKDGTQDAIDAASLFVSELHLLRDKADRLGYYKAAEAEWDDNATLGIKADYLPQPTTPVEEPEPVAAPKQRLTKNEAAVAELMADSTTEAKPESKPNAFLARLAALKAGGVK